MIGTAIKDVIAGRDLSAQTMQAAMECILRGEASEAQIAALVVALRMKGESGEEIAAAARAMRQHCTVIEPRVRGPLVDTCGTGGDGLDTFNISTAAAIVVAACGVRVAKHGNRAVSSRAGSADVLEALGVQIDLEPSHVQHCIETVGIGFLFAPSYHAAMRHAAPVRRQLGVRTIFNLLGPLSNPAGATHQLVGVYDDAYLNPVAEALGALGLRGAWVVYGEGGLDEVSPEGQTRVAQWDGNQVHNFVLTPADFELEPVEVAALAGGDAQKNARIITDVLDGKQGASRSAVVINAAATLCVSGAAKEPASAATLAARTIDDGHARTKLEQWVQASRASGQ